MNENTEALLPHWCCVKEPDQAVSILPTLPWIQIQSSGCQYRKPLGVWTVAVSIGSKQRWVNDYFFFNNKSFSCKTCKQLTFFCTRSVQEMDRKNGWLIISLASSGPPPSRLWGSLARRPLSRSFDSWDSVRGNLTSSIKINSKRTSWSRL